MLSDAYLYTDADLALHRSLRQSEVEVCCVRTEMQRLSSMLLELVRHCEDCGVAIPKAAHDWYHGQLMEQAAAALRTELHIGEQAREHSVDAVLDMFGLTGEVIKHD